MIQENNINFRIVFGKNVARLREKAKLTREELSLILGVDNSYVSKLEKGKINITIDKIEKIAEHFNINVSVLFAEIKE